MSERQLWIQNTHGGGAWANVSLWVDLHDVEHTPRAEGDVSTLTFRIRSLRPGDLAALPFEPIGGCEVLYLVADAFGPTLHDYRFGGAITLTRRESDPAGWVKECRCASREEELNARVNYLAFDPATARYDTTRIAYLLETLGALDTTWDGTTYVSGPFVDYQGGAVAPGYYRESLWTILQSLATTTPTILPTTTHRRWWVGGRWADSTLPGTGPLVRTLHYYAGLTGPQEATPLTDSDTQRARLLRATFSGVDSGFTLPQPETSQEWQTTRGTWGTQTGRAKLVAVPIDGALAYIDLFQADVVLSGTFATQQTAMRLAFRVTRNDAWTHKWEGLIVQNGGSDYSVWRRDSGGWTQIGSGMAVTPANGDVIEVTLAGSTISVKINGTLRGTFTSTFNQTATMVGISADALGTARWDNIEATGAATQFFDPAEEWDYTALCNTAAVEGPGADPLPPTWDHLILTAATGDTLTKTDAPAWQASHATSLGEVVRPVANPNGLHYTATVAGTTAGTEPTWPTTDGATVTDGSVTWTCRPWDSGAITTQVLTEDGGYLAATLEETLLVNDGASRPDGPPGKTETGQSWSVLNGSWALENGHFKCTSATGGWLVVDAGAGLSAVVEATAPVAPAGWRLAFRVVDTSNAYYVRGLGAGAGCDVVKRAAGVDTVLHHNAQDISAGTAVKVRLLGSSISLYLNGVFKATVTDTFLQGATLHGLSCAASGYPTARWDDFKVREAYTTKILGLGPLTTVTAKADIAHGILIDAATSTAQVIESGTLKGSTVAANLTDSFKIEIRPEVVGGVNQPQVKYWRLVVGAAPALIYTSLLHPVPTSAAPFVGQAVFYHVGATWGSLQTRRFTYGVYDRADSLALYGRRWLKTIYQDDTLDTDAKRAAWAGDLFDRHAYPRGALEVTTEVAYNQGRRALVNYSRAGWVDTVAVISNVQETLQPGATGEYRVRLGDRPYEYDDDEPIGELARLPDRDTTAPRAPVNWREGVHERGPGPGGGTWVLHLLWDSPPTDAQWLEAFVQPVGGGWRFFRWPAARRDGPVPDLLAGGVYRAYALYRDFAGHAGTPSATITITLPLFGQPPAPVWAGTPFPARGWTPGVGYWADLAWGEVAPAYQPARYWAVCHPTRGLDDIRAIDAPAAGMRVTGLAQAAYTVNLFTEDAFGIWSDASTPQTLTIVAGPPTVGVPGGGLPAPDQPLWPYEQTAGTATPTVDSADPFAGAAAYKVTSAGADVVKLTGIALPSYAGEVSVVRTAAKKSGGSPTLGGAMQFDDGSGTWVLTASTLTLPALTTSWPTKYTEQQMISPATTKFKRLVYTFTFAAALTILASLPQPTPAQSVTDLALNTDPATPIPINDVNGNRRGALSAANATPSNIVLTGIVTGGVQVGVELDSTWGDILKVGNGSSSGGISLTGASNKDLTLGTIGTGRLELQGVRETRGASFPASPTTGDRHYRTDLHLWAYWDGARWLSEQEVEVGAWTYYVGATVGAELTTTQEYMNTEMRDDYAYRITRFRIQGYVNGTNNIANNWSVTLRSFTGLTTLATLATSSWSGATWTAGNTTSFSAHPSLGEGLQLYVTKTGAPGPFRFYFKVYARLVIT